MEDERFKYNGFKLISLDLRENTLMGKKSNLFYNFIESNDIQKSIYTTVLIGANGTGKSNLFRILIELFKELEDLSKNKKRSYNVDGKFSLKFSTNGDVFEYSNIYEIGNFVVQSPSEKGSNAFLLKNGNKAAFEAVQLPLAIVANSIMLTDKYPFYKKDITTEGVKVQTFPRYKYLGVRNIAQNASTRAYVRRTVEFIVQEFNSVAFRNGLAKATKFLSLSDVVDIYYYTSNTPKFFRGKLTPELFKGYFEEIREKYKNTEGTPPFKLNQYLKIKNDDDLLLKICDFCKKLFYEQRLKDPGYKYTSTKKIIYNLIDYKSFEQLNEEFLMLEHLRQLGMISAPEIQLKREDGFSLQECSSGEYHFFSSIVGFMATVKTNSLIFIDEPEISLHPNWQMKYLTFIRELFSSSEYATSHILVATHSHFLISDLKADSSKIIGLKRESDKIEIVDLPENINTFGWSPDDVLYNVFNVISTRNKFVAENIADLLNDLSKGDKHKINKLPKDKYDELIYLENSLKDSDPLKTVVKSIINQINN